MTMPAVMPPNQPPPQVYESFAKGITDYFVDPPAGFARKLDNLLLTPQGKPYQRPGSTIWNTTTPALTNAERIGLYFKFYLNDTRYLYYLAMAQNRLYYSLSDANSGSGAPQAWTQMDDGSGNTLVFKTASQNARFNAWKGYDQILVGYEASSTTVTSAPQGDLMPPVKVLNESTPIAFHAGLPNWRKRNTAIASSFGGAGHSYNYYGVYTYTWTSVNGTVYRVRGTPGLIANVQCTTALGTGGSTNTFTLMPHSGGADYPLSPVGGNWLGQYSVQQELYRTTDGGTVPYLVSGNSFSGAGIVDNNTDAALQTATILYTNDGTLANGLPPQCKFTMILGQCGYYANCCLYDQVAGPGNGFFFPQRLYQSSPGIIDGVPGSFFLDFEEPIFGLSYYDTFPLVFLQSKHYRVEGIIDQQGNGAMEKRLVSGSTGCICNNSIVPVGRQIFFAGNDGFYMCNGFTSQKISGHLNLSYAQWTASAAIRSKIQGVYNPGDNRIYWSVCLSAASTDNDLMVVLDLNHGLENGGVFTTWSGGTQLPNWYATALLALDDGTMLRGDRRGFTFWHQSVVLSDPVYDAGTSTAWAVAGVFFDLQTPVSSQGDMKATKWYSKIFAEMYHYPISGQSSLYLQFKTEKEKRNVWTSCAIYRKTGLDTVQASDIAVKRMVPSSAHRSRLRSWEITKAWANLYRSDDYKTVTITGTNTLQMVPTMNWPLGIEKIAKVALSTDGYVAEFPILTRSGDTITVSGGPANGTAVKWVIRNYSPLDYFYFESLTIPFVYFGGHGNTLGWTSTEDNTNA